MRAKRGGRVVAEEKLRRGGDRMIVGGRVMVVVEVEVGIWWDGEGMQGV